MRGRWIQWLALFALGCDSVDAGRLEPEPGPPRLVKLMVLDPARGLFTDLLNTAPDPDCSDTNPCDSAPWIRCAGVCIDVSKPAHTPPSISGPGGNIVRLVFSDLLDPALDREFDAGGDGTDTTRARSLVGLTGPLGEANVDRAYDPSGSPLHTTDPIGEPYGPAIVMTVGESLLAGASYRVHLDPAAITDAAGRAVVTGQNEVPFVTEELELLATAPDLTATTTEVVQNEVLQLGFNAPIDEAASTATASTASSTVAVLVWLERGRESARCTENQNPRILDLARASTSTPGAAIDWAPGRYSLRVTVRAEGSSSTVVKSYDLLVLDQRRDPETDSRARERFVLPNMCGR